MTKKLHSKLLLLLVIFISFSCSKDVNLKEMTPTQTINFLLVNKQIPIKTLSGALEWPENIIIGINLGLIELNEDGKEKTDEIYKFYTDEGKENFIKEYRDVEIGDFIKDDWIKKEIANISESKLNEIREQEFKNNEIIQLEIENFLPSFIEKQTEKISDYQFSFFSKGFWGNLFQISWMHVKSTFGKMSNRDISYLKPDYINELQLKWHSIFNLYFSPEKAQNERENILVNYQKITAYKYNYLSKLKKGKSETIPVKLFNQQNFLNKVSIDIKPIINQFNLTMIDNFGVLFIEFFLGLFAFAFVRYILIKLFYNDELHEHQQMNNMIINILHTTISPLTIGIAAAGGIVSFFVGNNLSNRIDGDARSVAKYLKIFIGVVLLLVSLWYFPKKQNEIENEINKNLKTNFSSYFDKASIMILDDLDLKTELFYNSIK